MKEFNVEKFKIRLMDKTNKEEVEKVQRLRYLYLLKDYNPSLPAEGVDADGYDDVSDSILVIDTEKDVIAGTYRVATNDTINGHKFLTEDEYDIHELIESGERFLELGRAVVHVDYRNGFVIQLLLLAIYHYATEHNCKYYIGLCSFHGVDPSIYDHGFSFLARDYSFKKYNITACNNAFDLHFIDDDKIDILKAKEQLPSLLRMYLRLGHRVCVGGSIDYNFNSCDVLIILDSDAINIKYFNRMMKINTKD
ncbi:GNAT family N-acetyltransferase [bacterium]|nr:GNAT family N-acetyltransferase [bacterium]